jgi:hypothetical protein
LFVFDDAGFATRRTNAIFPSEFHHQFIDLLNPRLRTNNKRDYLDEALKRHDRGASGLQTRIIVVLPEDSHSEAAPVDTPLATEERALLERLSIFRFGCNRHAGFAMANFEAEPTAQFSWKDYERTSHGLIEKGLLLANGPALFLTREGRRVLGQPDMYKDPWCLALAHRHAALALCPILYPKGARISTNRDRQLEPENVLEASWHLEQAFHLVPWRFQSYWRTNDDLPPVGNSQALLTYLRTSPDWDNVTRLRVNSATRQDSVELCKELLDEQKRVVGREPPSPVVGLAIETLGRVFKNEEQRQASIAPQTDDIGSMVDRAIENLKNENLTKSEWQRRLRHLFSKQIFALRMLGLPLTDSRVAGARTYIDNAVKEILKPDFLETLGEDRKGLDDFPISKDCWRALWSDGNRESTANKTLSLIERSRYAYAAARANLSKTRPGSSPIEPWDEPWIAYFILSRPEEIGPRQISAPLNTWWSVYGASHKDSLSFGKRVLDMQPHAQRANKGKGPWEERWIADICEASGNLWRHVTHPDLARRLIGAPVAPALRLIASVSLRETLPAWRFFKESGPEWLEHWPTLARATPGVKWPVPASESFGFVAEEWSALGRTVVLHNMGWTAMLAGLSNLPDRGPRLAQVMNWLQAYETIGSVELQDEDPESLISKARQLPLVAEVLSSRRTAILNARALLALRTNRGFALYGHYRKMFECLLSQVES